MSGKIENSTIRVPKCNLLNNIFSSHAAASTLNAGGIILNPLNSSGLIAGLSGIIGSIPNQENNKLGSSG
jgi:hypothetical protein